MGERTIQVSAVEWRRVLNDLETIRCRATIYASDGNLVRELIDLREWRDAHPLPPSAKPTSIDHRPKSALVLHMEALAVFGEYCDRESRRLSCKLSALENGAFNAAEDAADRERNEAIGSRAVALEAKAADASPGRPMTPEQPNLFGAAA